MERDCGIPLAFNGENDDNDAGDQPPVCAIRSTMPTTPAHCPACSSRRLGDLSRLHEYLTPIPDDEDDEGVYISVQSDASRQQRLLCQDQVGELCAVVCGACGYVELYVKDSAQVPWERDQDFTLLSDGTRCDRCGSLRTGRKGTVGSRGPQIGVTSPKRPWWMFLLPRREGIGWITGIVCVDCGYLKTFVWRPETIPWDHLEQFERLERPEAPCRACGSQVLGHLHQIGHHHATIALRHARRYQEGVGRLRAVVCTACGYFETFIRDVDKMEWSGLPHFDWRP